MKSWLSRLFGDMNGIPDDARLSAFALVLTFIFLSCWNVIAEHRPFDPWQFGIGAGALATGVGAWFGLRKSN